jgi:glutamate dehydrogenase
VAVTVEPEEARAHLQTAIEAEAEACGEDAACFIAFATAFLASAAGRPLQTHGAKGLAAVARDAFALAARREQGQQRVDLCLPPELPGRTVITLLQEDRPFLVDTLRLFLRRHGLQAQVLLHPTMMMKRGDDGVLLSVGDEGAIRESFIYIEFYPRVEEGRARALEVELRQIMGWVANITGDHRRMIRVVREIGASLESASEHIEGGGERLGKIGRFLEWIVEDHFVFMGTRAYDVRTVDGELEIVMRAGGGLGMWRDQTESRFSEPQRGIAIPAGLRNSLEDPRIVQVSKGWTESRIHRAGRIDRILVKDLDDRGEILGFYIVAGLFTFSALRTPSSHVPLLAERLEQILEAEGAALGSHRYKAFVTAFDSAPMEFLLGAEVEDNAALIREVVYGEGGEEPSVVLRSDAGGRSFYAAVLLPRERYSEELRSDTRSLLKRNPAIGYIDDRVSFLEEGTALLHFFCTLRAEGDAPRPEEFEREVRLLATRWEDQLTDTLIAERGAAAGGGLAARYAEAFPETLRVGTHPADAVRDVDALESLHRTGAPQIALVLDRRDLSGGTTMLRIYMREEKLLSDLLPMVDHFGIRVIDARQTPVLTQDRETAFIHALRVLPLGGDQADLDQIAQRLEDALREALVGTVPDDALNALVLVAGIDWREVELIRTYLEYFNQIQTTLTRAFVRDVLLHNPIAVRLLIDLCGARLRPGPNGELREKKEQALREAFEQYRDRISSLNEDRALGAVLELISATLRTNFFARIEGPHRIAVKLDPSRVSMLKPPHAYREIFVHGSGVDGIHIRGGPVARGGIRWSDRIDDFRTEVLDLMRTQQLKNGLIVPVGAKGGFVVHAMDLSPQEARERADEGYRVFISGLLDLTDNINAQGQVVPPVDVFRSDVDDPYLVVAADKGTAHLSDAANSLALERGFWLGDAFASGGSIGYDHKRYAITARGAWECVTHHFAELGIDPENDRYSVVGIGDMSGDVFGNGLLLMKGAQLIAAFDHRHVFLDPNPDPERAWAERKRLFDLPRSSWADYEESCISAGGGVWPRSAKRIELSLEARERLRVEQVEMTGPELVRAVLAAPVDLLWNGGIGTYVKAGFEAQVDVGDRANESVRIDAAELRARVIGEGGNLGLTQAARVEAARGGVRLDTDAIHNSAGVDLSDHEVNFKILLAPLLEAGTLSPEDRVSQLFEVAEEACESVLAHNRAQVLSISLDERRSRQDLEPFREAIETLCSAQRVAPSEVGLPDATTLQTRKSAGEGLTRPELSVLLGLAKLHTRLALAATSFVEHPSLEPFFEAAFPAIFRARYPDALHDHRLRREMTALAVANRIIDAGGVTAVTTLIANRGLTVRTAAGALMAADEIFDAPRLRAGLLALRGTLAIDSIYDALLTLDGASRDIARYLLAEEHVELLSAQEIERSRAAIYGLGDQVGEFLEGNESERLAERIAALIDKGIPEELAGAVAGAPLADRALNIIRLVDRTSQPAIDVARAYYRIGEASGISWVFQNLARVRADDPWERMVLTDLRSELLGLQRGLTEFALRSDREGADAVPAVDAFLAPREEAIRRVHVLQSAAEIAPSASALTVVTQALTRLRPEE